MTRRQQSITAAAAMVIARRELARDRPGRAFRTRDRVRVELDRFGTVARQPSAAIPDPEAPPPIERLLAAGEVALALVAALAHGGDETTDGWWFGSIGRFARDAGDGEGAGRPPVDLRRAAPVLVLYAAGVAAVAAERWALVARLLTTPRPGHREVPVAAAFGLDDAGLPRGAQRVNGYVAELLTGQLSIDPAVVADAWERFDYLVLLAAGELRVRGTMLQPYWRTRLAADGRGHPVAERWFLETVGSGAAHPLAPFRARVPRRRPAPR
jgi:hypothetical protein